MKAGFWINYRTGQVFEIHEHERWIRNADNARALGVPPRVIARFRDFTPAKERDKFLLYVMRKAPVMRVRGHGDSVTFEFCGKSASKPLAAIRHWAENNAGPLTLLNIVNLAGPGSVRVTYKDFHRHLQPVYRQDPVSGGAACAYRDRSPEACRKRTEALKATIPPGVLKQVQGRPVTRAGVAISKFAGRTRLFDPPTTLDDAIHRLANCSGLGICLGFIALEGAGKLIFEADVFRRFEPSGYGAHNQTHKQEEEKR